MPERACELWNRSKLSDPRPGPAFRNSGRSEATLQLPHRALQLVVESNHVAYDKRGRSLNVLRCRLRGDGGQGSGDHPLPWPVSHLHNRRRRLRGAPRFISRLLTVPAV